MTEITIALDRASVRRRDEKTGHLHVSLTPISRAAVNGYLGREIPKFQELGLDASRIYKLYRHPEELEKAADTFNGKPLLFGHKPISAADHDHEKTVGGIHGTIYKHPFLMSALDVWPSAAIDAVESGEHEQLSSAYTYDPDMTPGRTPEGERYDGVMRNIHGQHVALVPEGRAGKEVRVHDSAPHRLKDLLRMAKVPNPTRTAAMAQGAIMAYALPRLAQDAKVDFTKPFVGMTKKNAKAKAKPTAAALDAVMRPHLAQDAEMDQGDMAEMIEQVAEVMKDQSDELAAAAAPPAGDDSDANDAGANWADVSAFLEGKISDDDLAKLKAMFGGDDEASAEDRKRRGAAAAPSAQDTNKGKDMVSKTAMDAALANTRREAAAEGAKQAREHFAALRDAEQLVRRVAPTVGEISIACDSAEDYLRAALDVLKVDHSKRPAAVLADMVEIHGAAAKAKAEPVRRHDAPIAQDAAADKSFAERVPGADRIRVL